MSFTTYEELYRAIKLNDRENIMHSITEGAFSIRLDEHFEINVYDNNGEVYMEITFDGSRLRHMHPDYQDAYDCLSEFVANPKEALEVEYMMKEISKKRANGCIAFCVFWFIFLFIGLYLLAEMEKSMKDISPMSRGLMLIACLLVSLLMSAVFMLGFTRPFHKKKDN